MENSIQIKRLGTVGLVLAILIWVAGLSGKDGFGYTSEAPTLETSFASKELPSKDVWEVYIKGYDPDGDLRFIQLWLNVGGFSSTPNRIWVKRDQRGEISGYLRLHTGQIGGEAYQPWKLNLQVSLVDRAGNHSERKTFPLTLYRGAPKEAPPSGVFEDRYLGSAPFYYFPFHGR